MVRSMMNLTTLLLSFWDYALEIATSILNMVPTKNVDKTPYELWYGKVPNLSYLKETTGYYFYFPPENKIFVARYAEFLEKHLLSQEISGRAKELEEIQDEDTSPSENTSEIPIEVKGFEPPQEEVVPVCRSARTHQAPDRLCLNVEVEEHSLGDLNEPANYKATILDLKSDKWLDAMNAKMQSMKDNQVWCLVDLTPNCKTVGSKWIFKKKTDMDGIVQTYKAHLVAKVDCYCDAGFETDRDDIKSQTGHVFILNGGAVDWKSSKQSTIAMFATEAEYTAASEAALHFAYEPGVQKGARHYHRRYHYVRECIKLGEIKLLEVHADDNLADPFTKALSKGKLTQHARSICDYEECDLTLVVNKEFVPSIVEMAAIAALCVQYEAHFRPDMTIVVKALQLLYNSKLASSESQAP
ncbi:hypothetical protein Tco_1094113 [Tanacetum coccineum]|uniref:Retrotransposon protein, putative, Ty1-copia subclass n=1 Tax=Tanacetum coccineum TaxID=301880 RepID=A0ABQ5IFV8_9ASTR